MKGQTGDSAGPKNVFGEICPERFLNGFHAFV